MSGQDGVYKALEGLRVEVSIVKKQVTPVVDFLKRVQGAASRLDVIERTMTAVEAKLGIVRAPEPAAPAAGAKSPAKAAARPVVAPPVVEVVSVLDGPPEPSTLLAAAFETAENPAAVVDAIRDVALGFFQDLGQQIARALPKSAPPAAAPAEAAPEAAAAPAEPAPPAKPKPPARATTRAFVDDLGIPPGSVVEHVQTKG